MRRFTLAACVAAAACGPDPSELRPLRAGDPAPEWHAETLSGDAVDVTADGYLLVNVWATWCTPCREEMPVLQKVHDTHSANGLTVVGVSVDGPGSESDIHRFIADHGITFPIVHDPSEGVTRAFRTTGVPETFLIANGRVERRWIGPVTEEDVEGALEAMDQGLEK